MLFATPKIMAITWLIVSLATTGAAAVCANKANEHKNNTENIPKNFFINPPIDYKCPLNRNKIQEIFEHIAWGKRQDLCF